MDYPVIHLVSDPYMGHVMCSRSSGAHDCWCEPNKITLVQNKFGIWIMVVEHNDYVMKHREQQLADQDRGLPEQLAWINHALYDPEHYPTAAFRDIKGRDKDKRDEP